MSKETVSKGAKFLAATRPDLADMPVNGVQARITVGMCDERGIPLCKDRLFIMSARVERNTNNGDRSSPMRGFDVWNFTTPARPFIGDKGAGLAGRSSVRLRLQHTSVDDAYDVSCLCFRGPADAPKPPGKAPYCKSRDMVNASRWFIGDDGKGAFFDIDCLGSECPLRERGPKGEVLAKSRITLVARLDEPGFPALLVSMTTGSDVSGANMFGVLDGLEAQWKALQKTAQEMLGIPPEAFPAFSPYGLPVRIAVFEQTGERSRFPRWHVTLDASMEEILGLAMEARSRLKAIASGEKIAGLLPAPASVLAQEGDLEPLDVAEVLDPEHEPRVTARQRFAEAAQRAPQNARRVIQVQPPTQAQAMTLEALQEAAGGLQAGEFERFNQLMGVAQKMADTDRAAALDLMGEAKKRVWPPR